MATIPYFVLSPNTIVSALGLLRGPDSTVVTGAEDWRNAKVDVVIPALNEARHITLSLASLIRQTLQPRRIVLVDDGSTDGTVQAAEAFCKLHGVELTAIQRRAPIGKTPTVKRQARELDSDVQFVLDADTVLESPDYLARAVSELYKGVGIASVCGTVRPLRRRDRLAWLRQPEVKRFADACPGHPLPQDGWQQDILRGVTNLYRDVLYSFLQRFIYHGQNVFFGTMTNPVGCAVAYRRKYVEDLFDHFGPWLGDDLTNSEDIFIGFAMLDKGYRNVQLTDVYARTIEPPLHRLPRQVYLWSSAFLQSCYYFDPLVRSPFKALRRIKWFKNGRREKAEPLRQATPAIAGGAGVLLSPTVWTRQGKPDADRGHHSSSRNQHAHVERQRDQDTADTNVERRLVQEPYRQAFGRERTASLGRPVGWMLFTAALEKVFFPTALIIMLILGNWEALAVTLLAETAVCLAVLAWVMRGQRLEYVLKGLLVTPVRYAMLVSDVVTIGRFAVDIWVRRDRRWRK